MRKKFIPLSLALCLTLSGCGGNVVLERSYSVSTPHSEVYWENEGADTLDRKSTRLNSSHIEESRMPSSA